MTKVLPGDRVRGFAAWLLLAAVTSTVIAIAVAYIPSGVRKIGLFAVLTGSVTGWSLAALSGPAGFHNRPLFLTATGLFVVGVQVGSAVQMHRLWADGIVKAPDVRRTLETADRLPEADARELRQRIAERHNFRAWLAHRVSNLGNWPAPWPLAFWIGEVVVATAVGVWVASRSR